MLSDEEIKKELAAKLIGFAIKSLVLSIGRSVQEQQIKTLYKIKMFASYRDALNLKSNYLFAIMFSRIKCLANIRERSENRILLSKFLKWSGFVKISKSTSRLVQETESLAKEKIEKDHTALVNTFNSKTVILEDLKKKLVKEKEEYTELGKTLKVKEDKLQKITQQASQLEQLKKELLAEIESVKNGDINREALKTLKEKIQEKEQDYQQLQVQLEDKTSMINNFINTMNEICLTYEQDSKHLNICFRSK